ncbi:MAG: hypothetical protein ACE5FI_18170 [Anaerolineales bacterium]
MSLDEVDANFEYWRRAHSRRANLLRLEIAAHLRDDGAVLEQDDRPYWRVCWTRTHIGYTSGGWDPVRRTPDLVAAHLVARGCPLQLLPELPQRRLLILA